MNDFECLPDLSGEPDTVGHAERELSQGGDGAKELEHVFVGLLRLKEHEQLDESALGATKEGGDGRNDSERSAAVWRFVRGEPDAQAFERGGADPVQGFARVIAQGRDDGVVALEIFIAIHTSVLAEDAEMR